MPNAGFGGRLACSVRASPARTSQPNAASRGCCNSASACAWGKVRTPVGLLTARGDGAVSSSDGAGRDIAMSGPRGRGSGQTVWISGEAQLVSASTRTAPREQRYFSDTDHLRHVSQSWSWLRQRTNVYRNGQQTTCHNDRGGLDQENTRGKPDERRYVPRG